LVKSVVLDAGILGLLTNPKRSDMQCMGFVELPEVGDTITKGSAFGSIESVKAVEDLKAPINETKVLRAK
jgi:glycine cleavage system H lipoate-binding protein